MSFTSDLREMLLLWCDRRCCLCKKGCDLLIEVHHIEPEAEGGSNDEDNAIPLCFDCHAKVHMKTRPIGTMFKPNELKKRRDQVYEEYTRHLVPSVVYEVMQTGRTLPEVGFHISNRGNTYPIRAKILITLEQGIKKLGVAGAGHYDNTFEWNLNPGFGVNGHFKLPKDALLSSEDPIRAKVEVTLIDIYDRSHKLLPVGWVHNLGNLQNGWYLEPSMAALNIT